MGVHYAQLSILLLKYLQHLWVVPRDAAHQPQLPAHLGGPCSLGKNLSKPGRPAFSVLRATLDEGFPGPHISDVEVSVLVSFLLL